MIQASNELILGIELNEEYAQLTYFHPSVKEPLTLSFETDAENYLLPVAMRKAAGGKWELWDGTGEAAAKVTDLYRKLQTEVKSRQERSVFRQRSCWQIILPHASGD